MKTLKKLLKNVRKSPTLTVSERNAKMTNFSKLLTKMRESRGLTVPELARMSGYDKKSHYEYEDGSVAAPEAYKLRDICEALGATDAECLELIQAAFDDHKERIKVKRGYSVWKVK